MKLCHFLVSQEHQKLRVRTGFLIPGKHAGRCALRTRIEKHWVRAKIHSFYNVTVTLMDGLHMQVLECSYRLYPPA